MKTLKRKKEDEVQKEEQRSLCSYGGDGVSWFRGELLGKGSFGSVYLGNSKKPRAPHGCFPAVMAVKSAEVSVSGSIQKEREVLSNIGEHPNIIGCFGEEITTDENGEMVYNLLLEYGSGGTIAGLIEKSGGCGLPEWEVKRYARSILLGLNHIHECGYVHCDLKPENILLVPRNASGSGTKFKVKIGDFGLTKRAKQNNNKKRKLDQYLRGTPMYLSPEVVADCIQEPPSDIWAFGCIVLEMLTGKAPWVGKEDLDAEVLLSLIGKGYELPKIPDEISREGREFLKGCFSRKTMFRLTGEMLLNHSFIEGLVDDVNEVEEGEGILDADEVDSSFMLYNTDEECVGSEDEFFLPYWSEEEEEIDGEGLSSFAEGGLLEGRGSADIAGSIIAAALDEVINTSKQAPTKKCSSAQLLLPFQPVFSSHIAAFRKV